MVDNDLALKYRPHSWQEVVGQPAIISILQRQVALRKWKNTYLFAGPHGCGKTTVARILANEINNGLGNPIEIDGASNNGVDNIRNLIADSQQCSIDCDFKVYIIDEAHQLTSAAWDASLKLIEEPPESSVFIFCTTALNKIPPTILSRVQTFNFNLVDRNTIADRLEFIVQESVRCKYEREALNKIASMADGHVRDAIKMLDKCVDSFGDLTVTNVETTLGIVSDDYMFSILHGAVCSNIDKCVDSLIKVKQHGVNMVKLCDSLINFATECSLTISVKDKSITTLSKHMFDKVMTFDDNQAKLCRMFVDRLISFRRYMDESNAEVFIKNVLLGMCV